MKSAGVAARVNLFGFAVAEINYVRPLDRRGRGWLWQFNFSPGFDLEHDRGSRESIARSAVKCRPVPDVRPLSRSIQ